MVADFEFDLESFIDKRPVVVVNETKIGVPRNRAIVCTHWLRKQCKRGNDCTFLHEINAERMELCRFGSDCNTPECPYRHDKKDECDWYNRGHCKHGNRCRNRHTRKSLCKHYYAGFCPLGPCCKDGHPKFALPSVDGQAKHWPSLPAPQALVLARPSRSG